MAAEGDQILPPPLSSAAQQDLPSQLSNTEDAGEQLQTQAVQVTSLDSGGGREDSEELEEVKDANEGEQKQVQEEEEKEENPDSYREAKRRRTSPVALKKPEEPCSRTERAGGDEATAGGFSFSFDVRGITSPIETTPRFGSMVSKYNSADLVAAVAEIGGGRADEETGKAATKAALGSDT